MKIIVMRREEITLSEVVSIKCDLCGITTTDLPSWTAASQLDTENECVLQMRTGTRERGLVENYDCCPACWRDKLVPWLREQGAEPDKSMWGPEG